MYFHSKQKKRSRNFRCINTLRYKSIISQPFDQFFTVENIIIRWKVLSGFRTTDPWLIPVLPRLGLFEPERFKMEKVDCANVEGELSNYL